MKTASADGRYIDYWDRKGHACSGIRVWRGYCQAVATDPDEEPEGMHAFGEPLPTPLPTDVLTESRRRSCRNNPVLAEYWFYVSHNRTSDLTELLTGQKAFSEALRSARRAY